MPIFKIQHTTRYKYDRLVKESVNQIKIYPYNCTDQEVLRHDLTITGNPEVHIYHDYWGNKTGIFNLLAAHRELIIDSHLTVRTLQKFHEQESPSSYGKDENSQSLKIVELSQPDILQNSIMMQEILEELYQPGKTNEELVRDCCTYIFQNFSYIKGITSVETTVDEILIQRAGVCQDFVHVMLQILRRMYIPCRYVSGYICPNKNGLRGEGATHAWVEAWLPDKGWLGIDPTNNVWVSDTHVKLAVGRSFTDCSPVKGTFKGPAWQDLSVFVSVGYEDGQIAEEMNQVASEEKEKESLTTFSANGMQQ